MKLILKTLLVFITTQYLAASEEIEFDLPPIPPIPIGMESEVDEFFKNHQGISLHPNIEKEIEFLPCVIYHLNFLVTALSPNYKYCLIGANIAVPDGNGIIRSEVFLVKDKTSNKDWEELEVLEATSEILKIFKDQMFRSNIYLENDDIISKEDEL